MGELPTGFADLSAADLHNIRGVIWSLGHARIRGKSAVFRDARYRDAGEHLARLKHGRNKLAFAGVVTRECGLSVRRAYELLALWNGSKSLESHRAETASRVKRLRGKMTPKAGQNDNKSG